MISENTGGNYSHYSNVESLLNSIQIDKNKKTQIIKNDIFTFKYFWIILIFLYSIEWYLRNRIGLL